MRGVRSNSECGIAELGADGPARHSISVGRTWRTGPPPSSFAAGCRGPRQDGQAAKTKLLRRSCLRFWTRAWGQREFADKRTGHLKQRPKTGLEPSKVVLYHFAQHSVRHGDPLERYGGRYNAPPLASRHRLQTLGT